MSRVRVGKWIGRVVAAVVLAIFGTSAPALASPTETAVTSYTYDDHRNSAPSTSATSERGPPTAYDLYDSDAIDRRSRGALVRPDAAETGAGYAYDEIDPLAQRDNTTKTVGTTTGVGGLPERELRLSRPAGVAAKSVPRLVRPPLSIPKGQFGQKWGKHASDYGLDPGDMGARAAFQSSLRDVHLNPDEVRRGLFNQQEGAFFFRQGEDLLITKPDGAFISMYPGASTSSWFKAAEVFPH